MRKMRQVFSILIAIVFLVNSFMFFTYAQDEEESIPGVFFNSQAVVDGMSSTSVDLSAEDGFMRCVTTGDDPNIRIYYNVNTAEYPYMSVRYRISAEWTSNWLYLADTTYNTGFSAASGTWNTPRFEIDNKWHNSVFYFPDDFSLMANTTLTCIRIPCAGEIGQYLDVAHVAFFKTAEEAAAYEGCVPSEPEEEPELEPIDPATVNGVFFNNQAIVDGMSFTDVKLTAEDGFMRCETTGADPNIRIYYNVNTAEYPYMSVRYRISAERTSNWLYLADTTYNTGFSATAGTWNNPRFEIDNKWHNSVFYFPDDFSLMANTTLTCIRIPGAGEAGQYLDVAHVAFFKTAEDAARFEGYVPNEPEEEPDEPIEPTPIDPATVKGVFFSDSAVVADTSRTSIDKTAEDGFMRCVTTGDGANIRINATGLGVNTAEYPYMVIRYRTVANVVDDWLFVTSGSINSGYNATSGAVLKPQFEKENEWNNIVFNFATDLPALNGKNVEWIRIPCALNAGDVFDIAHVAFFKTEEDAARFEGYVPNEAECSHDWVEATCTAPKTCATCGETEGEALGHAWNDATCTAPKTCATCGETTGEALGHTGGIATCLAEAVCDRCGQSYGELGDHAWQGATCDAARHCELCGEDDGEALGHTGGTATCKELAVCDRCGEAYGELADHAWIDATCMTPKTCSVCDATEGDAPGHTWNDATCTSPKTCSACGETSGDAHGHTWMGATCIDPKTCSVCGDTEGDALGHTWIAATLTTPKTCSVCGVTEGGPLTPLDPAEIPGLYFNSATLVANMSSTSVKLTAEPGYMRVVTTGAGANIRMNATGLGVNTAEYPYMVIRYRTVADVVDDWMFVTSGTINAGFNATNGAVVKPQFEKENEWNNLVFCFTTDFPALNGKNVEWIRIPCGLNEGDVFDIAHIAFFKNAEDAARFEGYVSNNGCESIGHTWVDATLTAPKTCAVCGETAGEPLTPIDPALVPGISFNNEPANVNRVIGSGVEWAQEDGFLRVTTTGDDAWVGITNLIVNTAEYPYMAIRYRISGDRVGNWLYLTDDLVNKNFSATAGTWGNPKYQIDNQWYTVTYYFPTEFSAMANVNLTSVRLPGAADKNGGYLDIEYIAFFKTAEDVARFTGYPGRTECEKNGHTWTDATCTTPKTCSVCGTTEGEVKAHTWADATCTAPKTCTTCGATDGEAKGHTWTDATCTAPKTCSVCGATDGEAKGHTWADATTEAPKTCTVCGTTEGEPETEPVTDPTTDSVTDPTTDPTTDSVGSDTTQPVTDPATDGAESSKGCKSSVAWGTIAFLTAAAAAIVWKKKDD